jgi:hypothetical protein
MLTHSRRLLPLLGLAALATSAPAEADERPTGTTAPVLTKPAAAVVTGLCAGDVLKGSQALAALDAFEGDRSAIEETSAAALRGGRATCRPWAALALGRLHPLRAVPALPVVKEALGSDDELVRLEAYETVRRMARLARPLVPVLEEASKSEAQSLREFATTALESARRQTRLEERPFDLRLMALGRREDVPYAYLLDPEGFVYEVANGQAFLDGTLTRVADDAADFEGRRVTDDYRVVPHRLTLRLFEGGAPPPIPVVAKEHTGGPISIDFAGDLASFAAFLASHGPLNVVVESGGRPPLKVAADRAPWDAVAQHALKTANLAYRAEGLFVRVGRAVDLDRHPRLPTRTFAGQPVSFLFREVDLESIRFMFQDVGGVTIELPPGPHEPLTVYFTDVPWDGAFEAIAASRGWVVKRTGDRLVVTKAP